jgi:hypothetical protein
MSGPGLSLQIQCAQKIAYVGNASRAHPKLEHFASDATADNRWLREAFENRVPIIYFLGISPGRY